MWQERLHFLLGSVLIAGMINFIAWRFGFYRFPPRKLAPKLPLGYLLCVFAIFFAIEFILVPLVTFGWIYLVKGVAPYHIKLDTVTKGWINLSAILLCLMGIGGYFWFCKPQVRPSIVGSRGLNGFKEAITDFLLGGFTWLLSYPVVLMLGQVIAMALSLFYHGPHAEQLAVKQIKEASAHPVLFWTSVAAIVSLVPLIEELLFRGYLLNWLKGYFGRGTAILFSALIFACFHFSMSQGVDNFELLSSLFVLGCFLGFLFERQQSLWAPVGLHATFNAISILMIFLIKK